MVAGHLRQTWRSRAQLIHGLGGQALAACDHVAGLDEGDVFAIGLGHFFMAQAHELVDVELVVGEQHEVLEPLGRRAGVVAQAVQRIVHARRGEQRQRLRLAGARHVRAVGDAVVHGAQVGQVEHVAHEQAPLGTQRAFDVVVLGKREVDGDGLLGQADLQLHAVAGAQQLELLQVVARKQVGARQRGLVAPWPFDEAIGQVRGRARHGGDVHTHIGVEGAHRRGRGLAGDEALHGAAQVLDLLLVQKLHLRQGGGRVAVQDGFGKVG